MTLTPPRFALTLTALAGCAAPPITGALSSETLASRIVGDSYRIDVRLPPGYDQHPTQKYPVAYQLDGTNFGPEFDITAEEASSLEAAGQIPEMIVVGVGYPYTDPLIDPARGRNRDYVSYRDDGSPGGAANFLRFLREELIPHIDAKYRVDPAARVLMGHSLGGYFTLYAMFQTAGDPTAPFQRFIGGDPSLTLNKFDLLTFDQVLSAKSKSLPVRLFVEIARFDGAVQHLAYDALLARLRGHYPDLRLGAQVADTDHGGTTRPGFRDGLVFVLGGGK